MRLLWRRYEARQGYIRNSIIYKCSECGLSDSRLKEEGEGGEELVAKEDEKEKEEKKSC
jgi:hypothetical protein